MYAQENTRNPAVAKIADRTGCQRHSRSSKADDFHLIWKGICHFLLLLIVTSALYHRFQYGHFSVKKRTFCLPPPVNPNFENVPLALYSWDFVCL